MYICRKIRLRNYLLEHGFKYVKQEPDKYKERRYIWLFEDTPELRNTIEDYYSSIPQ